MAGVISFRTTKRERELLHQWTRERGFNSISQFIRASLGFELGIPGTESLQEADEIDNMTKVAQVQIQILDRLDELKRELHIKSKEPGQRIVQTAVAPAGFQR